MDRPRRSEWRELLRARRERLRRAAFDEGGRETAELAHLLSIVESALVRLDATHRQSPAAASDPAARGFAARDPAAPPGAATRDPAPPEHASSRGAERRDAESSDPFVAYCLEHLREVGRDAAGSSPGTADGAAPVDLEPLLARVDDLLARRGEDERDAPPRKTDGDGAADLAAFCSLDLLDEDGRRALERDLATAALVQRSFLPSCDLAIEGWELAHFFEPVGAVGGDLCDVQPGAVSGSAHAALADASGKGIAGSLFAGHVCAMIRALAGLGFPPVEAIERINSALCGAALAPRYATVFAARLAPDGTVEYCSAAQPALLARRGARPAPLPPTGLPVGMFPDIHYDGARLRLEPGDALILHSDGVTDARDPFGEEFGAARLQEAVASAADAAGIASSVRRALQEHQRRTPPIDDATLLVLRRAPR
ncbi:MAG: SpoIIE family protein phosphatase [Candidatus Polarisedimenticolia bacterium]